MKNYEGGLYMTCDVVHKVLRDETAMDVSVTALLQFRQLPSSLLQLMVEVFRRNDNQWSDGAKRMVKEELVGKTVMTT